MQKKVLLVDGYNVLRAGTRYAHLHSPSRPDYTHDHFNAAREALLTDVATFAGREYKATVVFDGASNPYSTGESQAHANINVIFSPSGTSADTVIEAATRQAVNAGLEVLVVSSDAAMQWTILGNRVRRMSVAEFSQTLEFVDHELQELAVPGVYSASSSNNPSVKNTLAARLDPKTRAALERLARLDGHPDQQSID